MDVTIHTYIIHTYIHTHTHTHTHTHVCVCVCVCVDKLRKENHIMCENLRNSNTLGQFNT
jgi:hypothetical protein